MKDCPRSGALLLAATASASLLACQVNEGPGAQTTDAVSAEARYIVAYKDDAGRLAAEEAGRVALRLEKLNAVAVHLPEKAVTALSKNPHIEYVEEDAKRYMLGQTTPYGITMVQAPLVSDASAASVKVCIIDSGYSLGHEDLPTTNVSGTSDPGGAGNWFEDGSGHGTHVAGTISAVSNNVGVVGVMPGGTVALHIVRVFGNDGTWAYSSSLVTALNTCVSNGAKVVSMSLGGTTQSRTESRAFASAYAAGVLSVAAAGNDGNTRNSYPASYSSVISVAAIDDTMTVADFSQQNSQVELSAPGVHVLSTVPMGAGTVASVSTQDGTSFVGSGMDGSPLGTVSGPLVDCGDGSSTCTGAGGAVCLIARGTIAFSDKVLACQNGGGVAAVIYNNVAGDFLGTLGGVATTIPSMSVSDAAGATLLGKLGQATTVAVEASNYDFYDGTSMATPHVSGVAALIWSHNPTWTNQQIRDALAATAIDLGAAGRDNAYGFGLIQAKDALDYLSSGGPACFPVGASCSANADCCSNSCVKRRGRQTCR